MEKETQSTDWLIKEQEDLMKAINLKPISTRAETEDYGWCIYVEDATGINLLVTEMKKGKVHHEMRAPQDPNDLYPEPFGPQPLK